MKKIYFKIGLVCCLILKSGYLIGQCSDQEFSFQPGERITYEVTYNWGIIWVDAGIVTFKTALNEHKGEIVYYFDAVGNSYKYYDWIFKVRDRYQSKLYPASFQPVWFQRDVYEGGYEVFNQYNFNAELGEIICQVKHKDKPLITDTLPLDACRFDVLSAVYYARNIDYNQYRPGDKIPVKFLIDDKFYETQIHFQGKEIIQNRSGKKYMCLKFSALQVEGSIFAEGEELVAWVTDDKNKIPIMAEAKILIGSVKAYLMEYEGLKYKLEAEVEDTR
jgi:hypothetical protein